MQDHYAITMVLHVAWEAWWVYLVEWDWKWINLWFHLISHSSKDGSTVFAPACISNGITACYDIHVLAQPLWQDGQEYKFAAHQLLTFELSCCGSVWQTDACVHYSIRVIKHVQFCVRQKQPLWLAEEEYYYTCRSLLHHLASYWAEMLMIAHFWTVSN